MSALTDKLKHARAIAAREHAATTAMADRLIAKGDQVAKLRDSAETAHNAVLDGQLRDLKEMEAELRLMSNVDPLDGGGAEHGPPDTAWTPPKTS